MRTSKILIKFRSVLALAVAVLVFLPAASQPVFASLPPDPSPPPSPNNSPIPGCTTDQINSAQPGDKCYLGKVPQFGNDCANTDAVSCLKQNGFFKNDVQPVVNVLSGLVGVAVVGTIILGGIQYSTAGGDNAEASAKAKKRIMHGVTALIAFLFLFAFIQWIIPGGIFS